MPFPDSGRPSAKADDAESVAATVAEQDQRNDEDPDAAVIVEKIAKAVHRIVLLSKVEYACEVAIPWEIPSGFVDSHYHSMVDRLIV